MGNPGAQYENTRHNAGFLAVDWLAAKYKVRFRKPFFKKYQICKILFSEDSLYLVKPLTFMNRSGTIVNDVLKSTKGSVSDLVVVCDNLDLPPGTCRFKVKGSSAGQKGLASIIENIGTENFKRLYVGIGRPSEHNTVIQHVLSTPQGDEWTAFNQSIALASEGLLKLFNEPPEKVMAFINS